MVEDIRINVTWRNHRKRKKLERILGSQGIVSWLDFLLSVRQNKPNGILTNMDEEDISEEANWPGAPNEFVKALLECKLIDAKNEKKRLAYKVHDWKDHNPYSYHSKHRSEKARNAAIVRWDKDRGMLNDAQGMRVASKRNAPSPSPSPSPNPLRTKSTDLEKEIEDIKKEISGLVKRDIFNPYEFDKKNERKHPEARLQVLTRAKQEIEKGNKEFLEDPWRLLTHILTVEHQNANERGGIKEHEAKKLELKGIVDKLK